MSYPAEKTAIAEFGGQGVNVITNAAAGTGSYFLLIAMVESTVTATNANGDNYAALVVPAGAVIPVSNTGNVTVAAGGSLLGVIK